MELPYEEFRMLEEAWEGFEDLQTLRAVKAEEGAAPTIPLSEIKKEFGLST
jgi:hypothetical protein